MSGVPLNLDWQQILLHLLNFLILFAILYFLLYKPVRQFMDRRKAVYQEMDDQARAAKDEAEKLKIQYQQQLTDAEAKIAGQKERRLRLPINARRKLCRRHKEEHPVSSQTQKSRVKPSVTGSLLKPEIRLLRWQERQRKKQYSAARRKLMILFLMWQRAIITTKEIRAVLYSDTRPKEEQELRFKRFLKINTDRTFFSNGRKIPLLKKDFCSA